MDEQITSTSTSTSTQRSLTTRKGIINFPAYFPVTTFGQKYPLDNLIRPYLPRLASAVMVSYYYAQFIKPEDMPRIPLLIDSGGFASFFQNTLILPKRNLANLEIRKDGITTIISPQDILEFQSRFADVAFTLDFPIPVNTDIEKAKLRQKYTIHNAYWAIDNRRRHDLPIFACIQGWDLDSYKECAKSYAGASFDGVAIGGLVPRSQNRKLVLSIVEAVRDEVGELPLHVFGIGQPDLVRDLFKAGVDSIDSSSYVRYAIDGKLFSNPNSNSNSNSNSNIRIENPTTQERVHLAILNLASATNSTLPLPLSEIGFTTFCCNNSKSYEVNNVLL